MIKHAARWRVRSFAALWIICFLIILLPNIFKIYISKNTLKIHLSNAQQSCVPATALKRKVAKLQFCLSVYLSVLFCLSVYLSISSFQKSIQNGSKILPNRSQNGQKSRSGGSLGVLCGVSSPQGACGSLPGRLWGSSSAALGASWASLGWLLGCLGRQAGASKGVLRAAWRASWGKFHPKMEPSWH